MKRFAQKARSVSQKKFAVSVTLTALVVVTIVVTVVAMAPLLTCTRYLTLVAAQTDLGRTIVVTVVEGMVCRVCTRVCRFAECARVFELCLSQPHVSL